MNRLDETIAAHRTLIRRALLAAAAVLPALALAAAVLVVAGWVDVGPTVRPAVTFLTLYVAPLFLAAPLWLRERVDVGGRMRVVDWTVVALAFARFVGGQVLPFSGHMLFLTYSALAVPISPGYRLLALVLLAETTAFKLWIWRDPRSWSLGLVLGLVAAAASRMMKPRPQADPAMDDVKSAAFLTWAEWGPNARIPRDERLVSRFPSVAADERRAWMDEFERIGRFIQTVAEAGGEKGTTQGEFAASIRREFPFMNDEAVGKAWFLTNYFAWHDGYM